MYFGYFGYAGYAEAGDVWQAQLTEGPICCCPRAQERGYSCQGMWAYRAGGSLCASAIWTSITWPVFQKEVLPCGCWTAQRSRRTMTAQSLVFSVGRYNDQAWFSNGLRKPGVRGVFCATVTVFAHWGRGGGGGGKVQWRDRTGYGMSLGTWEHGRCRGQLQSRSQSQSQS